MFKGFREFMLRGNVIDLAVAVVIGAAFAGLVKAFTDNLATPIVNMVVAPGISTGLTTKIAGQTIDWSSLINAAIAFLITALVVYFIFVTPVNRLRDRYRKSSAEGSEAEEIALLREIRDLLAERR